MDGPEKRLGAACPNGGTFFVCGDKPHRFVGCCGTNPCDTDNGACPGDKLEPMTFNKTAYDKIPPQACVNSSSETPLWYTCAYAVPPFMGCCVENPCQSAGCPSKALRQAVLSNDTEAAAAFLPVSSSTQSSTSRSSMSASSTSSSIATTTVESSLAETSTLAATATLSATEGSSGSYSEISKGAVAGTAVGSTIGGIILLGLLFLWFRRVLRLRRQKSQPGLSGHPRGQLDHQQPSFASGPQNFIPDPRVSPYADVRPPAYAFSPGCQLAHCSHTSIQAIESPAAELPATTSEHNGGSSKTAPLPESPCLGTGKMDQAYHPASPRQTRQSRAYELEDSSPQYPVSAGMF